MLRDTLRLLLVTSLLLFTHQLEEIIVDGSDRSPLHLSADSTALF